MCVCVCVCVCVRVCVVCACSVCVVCRSKGCTHRVDLESPCQPTHSQGSTVHHLTTLPSMTEKKWQTITHWPHQLSETSHYSSVQCNAHKVDSHPGSMLYCALIAGKYLGTAWNNKLSSSGTRRLIVSNTAPPPHMH